MEEREQSAERQARPLRLEGAPVAANEGRGIMEERGQAPGEDDSGIPDRREVRSEARAENAPANNNSLIIAAAVTGIASAAGYFFWHPIKKIWVKIKNYCIQDNRSHLKKRPIKNSPFISLKTEQ